MSAKVLLVCSVCAVEKETAVWTANKYLLPYMCKKCSIENRCQVSPFGKRRFAVKP